MFGTPDYGRDPAPALPSNLDHDQLIYDFICSQGTLFELAKAHGLSMEQLLGWYYSRKTQVRLRSLEDMADTRIRLLSKFQTPAALTRLAQIVSAGATPAEQRRAAAAILRHATKTVATAPARPFSGELDPQVPLRPLRNKCAERHTHLPSIRKSRVNGDARGSDYGSTETLG